MTTATERRSDGHSGAIASREGECLACLGFEPLGVTFAVYFNGDLIDALAV